eukprot:1242930-Pleurochrysis_carterae.AAC.4
MALIKRSVCSRSVGVEPAGSRSAPSTSAPSSPVCTYCASAARRCLSAGLERRQRSACSSSGASAARLRSACLSLS